ncbi:uncharacterized protein LOC121388497 isoform X2 [Gigantopelta aegis]|uniref:uncharacterized protein LOC121388497 isoform X2 n=1 Tax=Gigantopelta aegis TaxID=1735272 RepID=UPI001B88C4F4|nr:uncharacterized protein LOC121388497 isoform X2 [Gigantopelta aegis]
METRQKQIGPIDDVSLTPTRRTTRSNRADQDGGDMNACAKHTIKQKTSTPKRCTKMCVDKVSHPQDTTPSDSINDAASTSRMTRSRGKLDTRKQGKRDAEVRCQIHDDTPPKKPRQSARKKVGPDEPVRKMSSCGSDLKTESRNMSPLKSVSDSSNRDAEASNCTPYRRTRGRPPSKVKSNPVYPKEKNINAYSEAESCGDCATNTNRNPNMGTPNSSLNQKSFIDIKSSNNSEEKILKCDSQRHNRLKTNEKDEYMNVCPKHTGSSLHNLEGTTEPQPKQKCPHWNTEKSLNISQVTQSVGELRIEKVQGSSRQTKRCIIFTDTHESNVQEDNKCTSNSAAISSSSTSQLPFKHHFTKTDGRDSDGLIACDTPTTAIRQSKQVLSKNATHDLDDEPVSDPTSKLHKNVITTRKSPRLLRKYSDGLEKESDSKHLGNTQESRNGNLVTKRSSKCSSNSEYLLGRTNVLVDPLQHLPKHHSIGKNDVDVHSRSQTSVLSQSPVSLLKHDAHLLPHKSGPVVTESSETTRLITTDCSIMKDGKVDPKSTLPDVLRTTLPGQSAAVISEVVKFKNQSISNMTESSKDKDNRTYESNIISSNTLKGDKRINNRSITGLTNYPKVTNEQVPGVPVSEVKTGSKSIVQYSLPLACSSLTEAQGASDDVTSKESNDVLRSCTIVNTDDFQSHISHKVEDNKGINVHNGSCDISLVSLDEMFCPQNHMSSQWNCDMSEEQASMSSSESDGEMRYNVDDFVSRRRRLRSESQDSELWEGLPSSVRYRKSVSKLPQIKSTDAQNDFILEEGETCVAPHLFTDSVDDMGLGICRQSTSTVINSDTDSQLVPRCHEKPADNEIGCNKVNTNCSSETKHHSANITEDCEIKMVTAPTKSTEIHTPIADSLKRLDPILPNKESCRSLGDNRTLVREKTPKKTGTDNSQTCDQPSTSQNHRNDCKEMETDASSTKKVLPPTIKEDQVQTNASSNFKHTMNYNNKKDSPGSLQMEKNLQETHALNTITFSEDQTKVQGSCDSELKMTRLGVNSLCPRIKNETSSATRSTADKPRTRNGTAKAESNHNKSSDTFVKESMPSDSHDCSLENKCEIFLAPLNKRLPSSQRRDRTSTDKVEPKNTSSNSLPRYTLKNTPRPTSSHSIPWMYNIQRLNSDCQASPALNCRSKAKTTDNVSASSTINCSSKGMSTDSALSSPMLRYSSQIKSTDPGLASPASDVQPSTKTTESNTICSTSYANNSVTRSNQSTKPTASLMSTHCSSNLEGKKPAEDSNLSNISSVKIVKEIKTELNSDKTDVDNNKGSSTANKQSEDEMGSSSCVRKQNMTANETSRFSYEKIVLTETANETIVNDIKLNYQKSKFPKVVLTPLKRSQRLIQKYGIDTPFKEVRIKQKRKKHDGTGTLSAEISQCETPDGSKATKETSLDCVKPASDGSQGGNDKERKLAVRRHRRKQDLLGYQLIDTDDALEDRPLSKSRKKAHIRSNSLPHVYKDQTDKVQKTKDPEKRKNKKGKNKPKASLSVSTPSNIFGLRRKRGPVVDEELLANPLYNKHACVLWSSEHRRHYHLIHPEADFSQLDNILRKHWEELLPTEKMKYFNRARDAVLDEFKHSKKPSNETTSGS